MGCIGYKSYRGNYKIQEKNRNKIHKFAFLERNKFEKIPVYLNSKGAWGMGSCGFLNKYTTKRENQNGNKFVTFKLCHFAQHNFAVFDRKREIPEKKRFSFAF